MDQKTISTFYDKIAKEYTQQHGYDEHLSIPSLESFTSFLPTQAKILDLGCGGGQDAKFLTEKEYLVDGIDISKEMIKLAKKYAPKANFTVTSIDKLPKTKKYDGIRCCRVFHHIPSNEQDSFLHQIYTLLKKEGILYITSMISDKRKEYETIDPENNITKKHLTAKSFKTLLLEHNFKILKFKYWIGKKGMEIIARKGYGYGH